MLATAGDRLRFPSHLFEPAPSDTCSQSWWRRRQPDPIASGPNHHRLPLDLVKPLAAAMPTMETEILGHTIYILGATHAPKASPSTTPAPRASSLRSPR